MNQIHLELCSGPEWAAYVENDLLPWVLGSRDLGDDLLEVGPGPGLTTDILLTKAPRLTAVELDPDLADQLAERMAGRHVEVVNADATAMPLESDRFSAAACLTMLHHVPTPSLQDLLFAEVRRVLRPGGVFVGSDGTDTPGRRELHEDDIFVPLDPATLPSRLEAAGFAGVEVEVDSDGERFRFVATKGG